MAMYWTHPTAETHWLISRARGHIISGLEDEMLEKNVGDKFTVTIPPEKAYGLRDDTLIDQVPKNNFEGIDDIQIGMQFQAKTPQGVQLITVVGIKLMTV